jgi:hypothetical protein
MTSGIQKLNIAVAGLNLTKEVFGLTGPFKPLIVVVRKKEVDELKSNPTKILDLKKKIKKDMDNDSDFSAMQNRLKSRLKDMEDYDMGEIYVQCLYGEDFEDPEENFQFIFLNDNQTGGEYLVNHPLAAILKGANLKDKDKGVKLEFQYEEYYKALTIKAKDTNPYKKYTETVNYDTDEYYEDTNEGKKIFKSKKPRVLNPKDILNTAINECKNLNLESIIKALTKVTRDYITYSWVAPSFNFKDELGKKSHTKRRLLNSKEKLVEYHKIIDSYLDFIKYFYQEKPEANHAREGRHMEAQMEMMEKKDKDEKKEKAENFLFFKGKDLEKIEYIEDNVFSLLSGHERFVKLMIEGFDLSKANKMVERDREEMSFFRMSFGDNAGEELKRNTKAFIKRFLKEPTPLMRFLIRLAKAQLGSPYSAMERCAAVIDYFNSHIMNEYGPQMTWVLENNDELREEYFKLAVYILNLVSKSEYKEKDHVAIDLLVIKNLLKDTHNLPNEFYKLLFASNNMCTKDVYIKYLNNKMISKADKGEMFRYFMASKERLSENLSSVVGSIITGRTTVETITVQDIMQLLDLKYKRASTDFESFIKENKKCYLHQNVLKAISSVFQSRSHEHQDHLNNIENSSYFVALYRDIKKFVKASEEDMNIKYINIRRVLGQGVSRALREVPRTRLLLREVRNPGRQVPRASGTHL